MVSLPGDSLIKRLEEALPAGHQFTIHHVSAPPANCPALFSPPPNEEPEPTECESHFLSLSIDHEGTAVQAFAVEVLIYTATTLTTIFVSKADSTGYLHLANLSKGTPSPIKKAISAFLQYLIEQKRRDDTRLVLSLFARAQNQYLFPGSIENEQKHVLDDRGLIKWWCKIFDSILEAYPQVQVTGSSSLLARGYLVIPGCDAHETKLYFPRPHNSERWLPTDPLRLLGKSLILPERCLIPRFPDDPKARFAFDLDEELPENGPLPMNSPEKNPHPGKWRSVRSIEQFWELMAFRQECAAGRLVGFLWGLFEGPDLRARPDEAKLENSEALGIPEMNGLSTEILLPLPREGSPSVQNFDPVKGASLYTEPLSPIQAPDSPTPLPLSIKKPEQELPTGPKREPTPTPAEIGSLRLSPPAYNRFVDSLMDLDYADLKLAKESTEKFSATVLEEARSEAAEGDDKDKSKVPDTFGVKITGSASPKSQNPETSSGNGVAVLGEGLVRKKRSAPDQGADGTDKGTTGSVNVLGAGLIRKKPKV